MLRTKDLNFGDILKSYEGTGELLELYLGDTDRCLTGRVLKWYPDDWAEYRSLESKEDEEDEDIESLLLPAVIVSLVNSSDGADAGLAWINCMDLVKVAVGTSYLKSINLACSDTSCSTIELPDEPGLDALLELSGKEQKMVSFESSEDIEYECYGIVEAYNDEVIKLRSYKNSGEEDGTVYLGRSEIRLCIYDGPYERVANAMRKANVK